MKKIIMSSLIALSLSSNVFAGDLTDASGTSVLSGASIVIASIALPFILLDDLSSHPSHTTNNYNTTNNITNTTMTVNKVTLLDNGNAKLNTTVRGKETKDYTFEIPEKAVKNCDITSGTNIEVDKNKGGYTLHANNKVIGIVSNEQTSQYFTQKKQ